MIYGKVIDFQAQLSVTFRLPNSPDLILDFVVDSGFEGALTLPPAAVEALGLPLVHEMTANLADDSSVRINVHAGTIIWGDELIRVAVLAMGRRPLLGTALLGHKNLNIDFVENGALIIRDI